MQNAIEYNDNDVMDKVTAINGLLVLRKVLHNYFDDIVSGEVQFPYGPNTRILKLTSTEINHVRKFVDIHCRNYIDKKISETIETYKTYNKENVRLSDFKSLDLYFSTWDIQERMYQLPNDFLRAIGLDISGYVAEKYRIIVNDVKTISRYFKDGILEQIKREQKMTEEKNKMSPYEEYTTTLLDIYNQCHDRRERVDFILSLVKKGLTRGRKGVDYLNWDGHLTLYAGRLEWVKEDERPWQAMSRIMTEGIGEFLKDRRPVVFFPSTKSLRSFLKDYVAANMSINVPQELKTLPVNPQNEEETRWWEYVRKWIDCETSKMIDRICARYKAHVPILCRAKFPEWAVKWVYDLTVKGEES